jgi:hypothetical protein
MGTGDGELHQIRFKIGCLDRALKRAKQALNSNRISAFDGGLLGGLACTAPTFSS